jgi:hypothetical protein
LAGARLAADNTEMERAETALAEREQRYRIQKVIGDDKTASQPQSAKPT